MICLTGDIHHPSMETTDQRASAEGVEEVTRRYVDIAESYDIDTTLFVTGKFCEEATRPGELERRSVEIGGHTWSAFRPQWLHDGFEALTGCSYGPRYYQRYDIWRTLRAVDRTFDTTPTSWRTHAYQSNETTMSELARSGVRVVSDEVAPEPNGPRRLYDSLISLPINVMPDHEHIYHGARTREHVEEQKRRGWSDPFTADSYDVDAFFDIIVDQIRTIVTHGGVATVLLHPICMRVVDDFRSFERLCEWIDANGFETVQVSETAQLVD